MEPEPHTAGVTVSVDASDPLTGSVHDAAGRLRPFCGWLGLISALEEALAATRAAAGHEGRSDRQRWR